MERERGHGVRTEGGPVVTLRELREGDLPALYEHQADQESSRMAAFASRGREEFMAHWRETILADETTLKRAIVVEGELAGNVLCFSREGRREIGYWLGREHWGRGLASRALGLFLKEVTERPLHACVAKHNAGSLRVLERNGFRRVGEGVIPAEESSGGEAVEEWVYVLG